MAAETRPSFYALAPGGWRDYITLLHPPYTLWHLSYVAIGAALAPDLEGRRLLAALAAFFLALGIGAHALDELAGRPLQTRIGRTALVAMAVLTITSATAIGIAAAVAWTAWLLPFVAFGAFIVCAYNLELFGGLFHSDLWFALSWGAFPLLTGYLVVAERLTVGALVAAAFAALSSLAQRRLSTEVRTIRRAVTAVSGTVQFRDGSTEPMTAERLRAAPEAALQALTWSLVSLAGALLILRLT